MPIDEPLHCLGLCGLPFSGLVLHFRDTLLASLHFRLDVLRRLVIGFYFFFGRLGRSLIGRHFCLIILCLLLLGLKFFFRRLHLLLLRLQLLGVSLGGCICLFGRRLIPC